MNKQFCDNCGKRSDDHHVDSINTARGDIKVRFRFEIAGTVHMWSQTDLCVKCKNKIIKEIAQKIIKEGLPT